MLNNAYQAGKPEFLLAVMIVVLAIGMVMDALFSGVARRARTRRGLSGFRA
jgi:ABC-type nitrate/sulfonate/bicarbonate transport system permease component